KAGDRVRRGDPLAEVVEDDRRLILPSPVEGQVVELQASEGDDVAPRRDVVVLDDGYRLAPWPMADLKLDAGGRLGRGLVEVGADVRRGEPVALIKVGDASYRLAAAETGRVARFEAGEGDAVEPGRGLLVTEVRGFEEKAFGRSAIWLAIALLMVGAL